MQACLPCPWDSRGSVDHEQGISKAAIRSAYTMVELAGWGEIHPASALSWLRPQAVRLGGAAGSAAYDRSNSTAKMLIALSRIQPWRVRDSRWWLS